LQLEAADALLDSAPDRARTRIRQALERARESLAEARRSVLDLRAGPLERQTLATALDLLVRRFADETGIGVTANIALEGLRLPARSEEALYRITQEALTNVRRHAQAGAVQIDLRVVGDQARLTISDDGRGFNSDAAPAEPGDRFGLIGMQERARLLNGTMRISSCPGEGAQVEISIPLIEQRRPR
jgi:signal transduction histidine kinase